MENAFSIHLPELVLSSFTKKHLAVFTKERRKGRKGGSGGNDFLSIRTCYIDNSLQSFCGVKNICPLKTPEI